MHNVQSHRAPEGKYQNTKLDIEAVDDHISAPDYISGFQSESRFNIVFCEQLDLHPELEKAVVFWLSGQPSVQPNYDLESSARSRLIVI